MKVLYLATDVFAKGGIPRYSRFQIRAFREGFGATSTRVLALSPPDQNAFEEPLEVTWTSSGPGLVGRGHFVFRALAHAALWRPDVVVANHVALAPVAVVAARAGGGRSLLNVYGLEIWSGLRSRDRFGLERVTHLISDCHFTADYVAQEFGISRTRVDVVWDCVDTTRLAPGDPNPDTLRRYGFVPDPTTFTIMTLGRLASDYSHKGFDRVIDLMAQGPTEPPMRYVIAGDGPSRASLQQRVRERGLDAHVVFTGSVREQDLQDVYRACDVFVLVSDRGKGRGEGVPLTPLEAAACAKPILVGNQDGSQEAVEDGVNGFVLDPFDLGALKDRLLRLARDPALRERMGRAARARVEREHAYEVFRDRTLRALRESTTSRPTARDTCLRD